MKTCIYFPLFKRLEQFVLFMDAQTEQNKTKQRKLKYKKGKVSKYSPLLF